MYEHILDNRDRTVAGYLRKELSDAEVLRLVSAYFSIYGYEQLADELDRVGEVRFLFGDPASVDHLDPGEKDSQYFKMTETGLAPNTVLHQKFLARRCSEWVAHDTVQVQTARSERNQTDKAYGMSTTLPVTLRAAMVERASTADSRGKRADMRGSMIPAAVQSSRRVEVGAVPVRVAVREGAPEHPHYRAAFEQG